MNRRKVMQNFGTYLVSLQCFLLTFMVVIVSASCLFIFSLCILLAKLYGVNKNIVFCWRKACIVTENT